MEKLWECLCTCCVEQAGKDLKNSSGQDEKIAHTKIFLPSHLDLCHLRSFFLHFYFIPLCPCHSPVITMTHSSMRTRWSAIAHPVCGWSSMCTPSYLYPYVWLIFVFLYGLKWYPSTVSLACWSIMVSSLPSFVIKILRYFNSSTWGNNSSFSQSGPPPFSENHILTKLWTESITSCKHPLETSLTYCQWY